MMTLMNYETLVLVRNGADLLSTIEERATFKHKIRVRIESLVKSKHLTAEGTGIAYSQITITPKGVAAIEEVDRFIEHVNQHFGGKT